MQEQRRANKSTTYWKKKELIKENFLFGKIEGIVDLVTFEGNNPAEVKEAFEESVDDYLEVCIEMGLEPNKPYKGQLNVRMEPAFHKELAMEAIKLGESLNKIIVDTLKLGWKCRKDNKFNQKTDKGKNT